jgi:putative (di)nucleoside polyphosphate hydrolase
MSVMRDDSTTAEDATYRPGVGIMLLNARGEVFVARRCDVPGETWQMPQGGIDGNEPPLKAAYRELKEEIGTDKAKLLAESRGWLRYDIPEELLRTARHRQWRGQRQKWFLMRFTGQDADIDLAGEHPEFDAWKWMPVRALPDLVVSFKRQVYIDLLSEFPEITQSRYPLAKLLADPIVLMTMKADSVAEQDLRDLLWQTADRIRQQVADDAAADTVADDEADAPLAHPLERLYASIRMLGSDANAYPRTARLLSEGPRRMSQKLSEEAVEVSLEAVLGQHEGVIRESADLLYNLLVVWAAMKIEPDEIWDEIERREQAMGLAEKLPKTGSSQTAIPARD